MTTSCVESDNHLRDLQSGSRAQVTQGHIYLAGPFTGYGDHEDWRDYVTSQVPALRFYDPRTHSSQTSSAEFTRDDLLLGVGKARLVFVFNPKGNYHVDVVGLALEVGAAFAYRIPVVLCDENSWIFPMLSGVALRLFTSLETATIYLNHYSHSSREFDAYYATISASPKSSRGRP